MQNGHSYFSPVIWLHLRDVRWWPVIRDSLDCLLQHHAYRGHILMSSALAENLKLAISWSDAWSLQICDAVPETVFKAHLCISDTIEYFSPSVPMVVLSEGVYQVRCHSSCWELSCAQGDNVDGMVQIRSGQRLAALCHLLMTDSAVRDYPYGALTSPVDYRVQGPHQGSYSLALVNRSLAKGLYSLGASVTLYDGQLSHDDDLRARWLSSGQEDVVSTLMRVDGYQAVTDWQTTDVVLYNDYPLQMWNLSGARYQVLANYAWEELGFPPAWVDDINARINLVTVVSPYVKRLLRHQGVRVPMAVVGNALDHFQKDSEADVMAPLSVLDQAKKFRFLHVSSGLSRKGVDILLEAYGQAFQDSDSVCLIIKTVGNPQNQCAQLLAEQRAKNTHYPQVLLIDEEWSDVQMQALYRAVQVLVMPSRAEGFGLPAAEAIFHGVPVIMTGFGGQVSLTSSSGAGLIDYVFTPSQSHLGLFDSLWVEPDVTHLVQLLRGYAHASKEELASFAKVARANYAYPHSWTDVAKATQLAIQQVQDHDLSPLPTIAWVSTYNSVCGIATYSENLLRAFPMHRVHIYANQDAQILGEDPDLVSRNWLRGEDDYEALAQAIIAAGNSIAVIQSQPGLMSWRGLTRLLQRLQQAHIATYVTLHNTHDWFYQASLSEDDRIVWKAVCGLFVHTVTDMNLLKMAGLVDHAIYFPHGVYDPPEVNIKAMRDRLGLSLDQPVLATFGFLHPHKGQQVLLQALSQLSGPWQRVQLLMLNTVLAEESSQLEWQACRRLIKELRLSERVIMQPHFLPEVEALQYLAASDAVIYPYQFTSESASGAVRMGLASGRPVLATPLDIFQDVSSAIYTLPGTTVEAIQKGLEDFTELIGGDRYTQIIEQSQLLSQNRRWWSLSRRLLNILEGDFYDPF